MNLLGPKEYYRRFVVYVVFALCICAFAGAAFAERILSDEAFEQLKKDVQSELDKRHAAAQSTDEVFPGATVAFILPDGRVAEFATGFSDVEDEIAMTPEARMPSGSIGKTYVAAVALSLCAEGTLNLDAKINRWLGKETWFEHLPNGDTITLRNLLNHSSGLIDHVFEPDSGFQEYAREHLTADEADVNFDPRDQVQFVLDREPLFPAGKGFNYTDTGYILVGLIIEEASGSTYYEELAKRFLKPLELTRTTPQNQRIVPGIAQGYAPASNQFFGVPLKVIAEGAFLFDPSIEWTGGGLVNNSQDLVRWAKTLYEGNAMDRPYLDALFGSVAQSDQGSDASGRKYGYGLGVTIAKTDFGTTYGHGGFFPGYNSQLAYFPEYKTAIAMQINTDSSQIESHFTAIAKIVIDALADK